MRSKKEYKKDKGKDPESPEKNKSHESTAVTRNSDTDIVEGGYWH